MLGSTSLVVGSLVRRQLRQEVVSNNVVDMATVAPSWAIGLLIASIVLSAFIITTVRYTNWEIISTLAMIESPTTTVLVKAEKPLSEKEDLVEAEVITIKQKPLTSSLKGATRHLRAVAGPFFRFRGLSLFIIYHAVRTYMHFLIMALIGQLIGDSNFVGQHARFEDNNAMIVDMIVYAATSAALAPLAMAFTHVIISLPGQRSMSKWIPSYSATRGSALYGAAIGHALTKRCTFTLPIFLFKGLLGDVDLFAVNEENVQFVAFSFFIIFVFTVLYGFLLLRATVILVRVQASMLPADVEPVVAFDRTFGGKVVSVADGGNGRLSVNDARPDCATNIRLIKLFAKMAFVEVKLHILAALLVGGIFFSTMGAGVEALLAAGQA